MTEVETSGNTQLLEAINQLDGLTVFAPIDDAPEWGPPMQQDGDDKPRTDVWGAYMVPSFLAFDDLVNVGFANKASLPTMFNSSCAEIQVYGKVGNDSVQLTDAAGRVVYLDKRD